MNLASGFWNLGRGLVCGSAIALSLLSLQLAGCGDETCREAPLPDGLGVDEWIALGPGGGYVTALIAAAAEPHALYAGTHGAGVFRSTDGGGRWSAASEGLKGLSVTALALEPGTQRTLYAGTWQQGLYKSLDGGRSWSPSGRGLEGTSVTALAVDPLQPRVVHAGTTHGLYRSADGGQSWHWLAGLPREPIRAVAADPAESQILYASISGEGLFKSLDGGLSWTALEARPELQGVAALAVDPGAPGTLYAGTSGAGVLKSTDGGLSWRTAREGLGPVFVEALRLDPLSPQTLHAGTYDAGAWLSTDGGERWTPLGRGLPELPVLALAGGAAGRVYAGLGGAGVQRLEGGSWKASSEGLHGTYVLSAAAPSGCPGALLAGTAAMGLWRTEDLGVVWKQAEGGLASGSVSLLGLDVRDTEVIFAGSSRGLLESRDAGRSWQWLGSFVPVSMARGPRGDTLYGGSYGGLFRSTNGGRDWEALLHTGLDGLVTAVLVAPRAPETIYAAASGSRHSAGGVWKSMDGGQSWMRVVLGLGNTSVHALAIDPETPQTLYAGTFRGLYKTLDGALSWSAAHSGLGPVEIRALALDPRAPGTLLAGTAEAGVYRSRDGARSWAALERGLWSRSIRSLTLDAQRPERVFAATEHGGIFLLVQSPRRTDGPVQSDGQEAAANRDGTVQAPAPGQQGPVVLAALERH
jgi:photosystem II stability/assembly factor-like uncharacterized protein